MHALLEIIVELLGLSFTPPTPRSKRGWLKFGIVLLIFIALLMAVLTLNTFELI